VGFVLDPVLFLAAKEIGKFDKFTAPSTASFSRHHIDSLRPIYGLQADELRM